MVKEEIKKPWYKSNTKRAALLIALGPVLVTLGGMLGGDVSMTSGMIQLSTEIGIVLGVFGIRDLPFVNKK